MHRPPLPCRGAGVYFGSVHLDCCQFQTRKFQIDTKRNNKCYAVCGNVLSPFDFCESVDEKRGDAYRNESPTSTNVNFVFWANRPPSDSRSAGQMSPSGPAQAGDRGSTEKLSPAAVNRMLMEFLIYFGKAVVFFYPVYLTGYLGLSISWVLLCMMIFTWWKKNRQWKDTRIGTALDFVDNETAMINKELGSALQMATWVRNVFVQA